MGRFVDIIQVAQRFGVSKATVFRWRQANPDFPPPIRLGPNTVRYDEDAVEAFIREQTKRPAPQ